MLYEPVRKERLFCVGRKYSDVDWNVFEDVVDAFERRIDQWYLAPVRLLRQQSEQHGGFAAMSICCIMIDCLCQFEFGKVSSNRMLFKKFIEKRLPHYNRPISPAIEFPKVDSQKCAYETDASGAIKTRKINSIADAMYYVYRCGILHSAHAPLCGVISGLATRRFSIRKRSLAKYSAIGTPGGDCPVVLIDPWRLFDEIEAAFKNYLTRLRAASASQEVRLHFNTKFEDCFGISIVGAR